MMVEQLRAGVVHLEGSTMGNTTSSTGVYIDNYSTYAEG
jgi:hypothetical protein